MAIKTGISTSGGAKLKAVLDKAEKNRAAKVKVGYIGDRYPGGEGLAQVAAAHNFGVPGAGIPERPFFSQSAHIMRQELPRVLLRTIDPSTLTVSHREAQVIGRWAIGIIEDRARALQEPPNAPYTLERKTGDSPLVDTGRLAAGASFDLQQGR